MKRLQANGLRAVVGMAAAWVGLAFAQTWNGTTDANWATGTNWSTGSKPVASGTAIFDNAGNGYTTLTVGSESVGVVKFDTAGAAAYAIGASAGAGTLTFRDATATIVELTSSVVANQTINSNLSLGTAANKQLTIINQSTAASLTIAGQLQGSNFNWVNVGGAGDTILVGGSSFSTNVIFQKQGNGTLHVNSALSGLSQFSVQGGTAQLNTGGSISVSDKVSIRQGLLDLNGVNQSFNFSMGGGPASSTGVFKIGTATYTLTSNPEYLATNNPGTAYIVSNGGGALTSSAPRQYVINDSANATIDLQIDALMAGANNGIQKVGAGALALSNASNSFGGNVLIDVGTVVVNALANSGANSPLGTANNIRLGAGTGTGTLVYAPLTLYGGSPTGGTGHSSNRSILLHGTTGGGIIQADGSGTLVLSGNTTYTAANTGNKTLTLRGSSPSAVVNQFNGAISNHSVSGTTSLVKAGSNSWQLGGTNTFSGGTTITGGTLILGGTGAINGGPIEVNGPDAKFIHNGSTPVTANVILTQGTIGGSGAINGAVGIGANAVLSPGNSIAAQSYGNLTWAGGGTYLWEINDVDGGAGSGWDLVDATGSFTLAATSGNPFTIAVAGLTLANSPGPIHDFDNTQTYYWRILDTAGDLSGVFSTDLFNLDLAGFANPLLPKSQFDLLLGQAGFGGDSTEIWLRYTLIPEPSAVVVLGLAALAAFSRRRRHGIGHLAGGLPGLLASGVLLLGGTAMAQFYWAPGNTLGGNGNIQLDVAFSANSDGSGLLYALNTVDIPDNASLVFGGTGGVLTKSAYAQFGTATFTTSNYTLDPTFLLNSGGTSNIVLAAGVTLNFFQPGTAGTLGDSGGSLRNISGGAGAKIAMQMGSTNLTKGFRVGGGTISVPIDITGSNGTAIVTGDGVTGTQGFVTGAIAVADGISLRLGSTNDRRLRINGGISGNVALQLAPGSNPTPTVSDATGIHLNSAMTYTGDTIMRATAANRIVVLGVSNALPTGTALVFGTGVADGGRFDLRGYN